MVEANWSSGKSVRVSVYIVIVSVLLFQSVCAQYYGKLVEESSYEPETGDVANCTYSGSKSLVCDDGETYLLEEKDSGWRTVFDLSMCIILVLFAGSMSGLTMGLLSMDVNMLKITAKSGATHKERKYAKKIIPLVRKHHLLLVTLLTANAIAMEALPLFLDRLVGPFFAIILSVTLVLLFGEIIPQALCTRYGLAIGATFSPLVWLLIGILFPIGYPLGKLLDCILGHDSGTFYRRAELKELVGIHELTNEDDDEGAERLTQGNIVIIIILFFLFFFLIYFTNPF